jgi:hypothetical protein
MLSFVYTGEIDDTTVNKWQESLLQLADRYQLDEMKSFMEGKRAATLCVKSFVHVALLADSHRCQSLKEVGFKWWVPDKSFECPQFQASVVFLRNNFSAITSGDSWKELMNGSRAGVAAELLQMVHTE